MLHQFLPEKLQSWPPIPYNRLSSPLGAPDCSPALLCVSILIFESELSSLFICFCSLSTKPDKSVPSGTRYKR